MNHLGHLETVQGLSRKRHQQVTLFLGTILEQMLEVLQLRHHIASFRLGVGSVEAVAMLWGSSPNSRKKEKIIKK